MPLERRHSAVLICGHILYYQTASILPRVGEDVPCVRHGYCSVVATPLSRENASAVQPARNPPRTCDQLMAFLHDKSSATLSELRRARFTLRLVEDARREGSVVVDADTERVSVADASSRR